MQEPINPASAPTETLREAAGLSTDEVRGGTTGHNVRYMLIFSLSGALIALAAAWIWVDVSPHRIAAPSDDRAGVTTAP